MTTTNKQLKIIALSSMTINHIGHIFAPQFNPIWWQFIYLTIGKLTFPILAYLLIEGYHYTSNIKRYITRLLMLATISIIPYHLTLNQLTSNIYIFNNVLWTLGFGLIMVHLIKQKFIPSTLLLLTFETITLFSDWNVFGILLIFLFAKQYPNYKHALIFISTFMLMIMFISDMTIIQLSNLGVLFVIPILSRYNHIKDYTSKWLQYGFYAYYPAHLLLLYLLHQLTI